MARVGHNCVCECLVAFCKQICQCTQSCQHIKLATIDNYKVSFLCFRIFDILFSSEFGLFTSIISSEEERYHPITDLAAVETIAELIECSSTLRVLHAAITLDPTLEEDRLDLEEKIVDALTENTSVTNASFGYTLFRHVEDDDIRAKLRKSQFECCNLPVPPELLNGEEEDSSTEPLFHVLAVSIENLLSRNSLWHNVRSLKQKLAILCIGFGNFFLFIFIYIFSFSHNVST